MRSATILPFVLALSLSGLGPACAAGMDMSHMDMGSSAQAAATEAVGVVDAVDAASGSVTISHEPIQSLGWPAMTMDFTVRDKKLFDKLGKGKKIRFAFIQQRGEYVVTKVK